MCPRISISLWHILTCRYTRQSHAGQRTNSQDWQASASLPPVRHKLIYSSYIEFVKLFAYLGESLNPSQPESLGWKDTHLSSWVLGFLKSNKLIVFFCPLGQSCEINPHCFKSVLMLRMYTVYSGFYNKSFITCFLSLLMHWDLEYIDPQVSAEYESTVYFLYLGCPHA